MFLIKNLSKNKTNFFKTENFYFNSKFNIIQYLFHYNNFNLRSFCLIPNEIIVRNNKNFFNFLEKLCENKIKIIFLSSFLKKNSLKSLSFLNRFYNYSNKNSYVVCLLQHNISKGLMSKLTNNSILFIKPIVNNLDFNLNVYPLFINLENDYNVYSYTLFLKCFFKNYHFKKKNVFYKKYFNLIKLIF